MRSDEVFLYITVDIINTNHVACFAQVLLPLLITLNFSEFQHGYGLENFFILSSF